MTEHPYRAMPDTAYWRRSVAATAPWADPIAGPFLKLSREDKVATAGSCFAQHIARHLAASGFHYLVTETAHPIIPAEAGKAAGYGLYTARYGNIYTTLQLVQLFDRAYGRFEPAEALWRGTDGSVIDPFRPTIQPGGFSSEAELLADRAHHFAKVREAFETLDVFVFTLGLTEGWVSAADGAAFPICPGVAGGTFDPARYRFHNLRASEVRGQLQGFIERLRSVNPRARVMLTVSPVPLAATASAQHVLPATIYSKSVLRVAAQEVCDEIADVFYFPSYEIITGPQARGRFYAEDLREVTEEGVSHVMSIVLRHAAGIEPGTPSVPPQEADAGVAPEVAAWIETMCDEAMLDQPAAGA